MFCLFFTLEKYAVMLAVLGNCSTGIGIVQTAQDGDLSGAVTFPPGSVAGAFARCRENDEKFKS